MRSTNEMNPFFIAPERKRWLEEHNCTMSWDIRGKFLEVHIVQGALSCNRQVCIVEMEAWQGYYSLLDREVAKMINDLTLYKRGNNEIA